ncbi:MAG: Usg family protein [Proteobacteria bacterium]|nr:Usg family protein [Pseudomonadota bacterium]
MSDEMRLRLAGYRLTTTEILYYLPDHPGLLQSFVWQGLDRAPEYPALRRFLAFWEREIEARLHSVKVATSEALAPPRFVAARGLFELH